jgi:paraquat-inducible protein A
MLSMREPRLIACHECDLLQREVASLPPRGKALCTRCSAVLYRNNPDGLDRTLAYALGAAVVFVLANAFPIVDLDAQGNRTSTTLLHTVRVLHDEGMTSVAALVFVTTFLAPALEIAALVYLLAPLRLGRVPPYFGQIFRLVHAVRPWGMVEVLLLGTLVSLAKLAHLAHVEPGIALWSFAALMVLLAAAASAFDTHALWERVRDCSMRGEATR